MALRQRANAYAMLGEPADFVQDIEDARVQATQGVHQAEGDLAPYCTPSYVEMEAGASWVRLDAADSAIPVFEDSRAQWNCAGQVRDRALCLARLATAYATAGEPGQACAVIAELIAIADGLGSARVAAQITELRAALAPWRSTPTVTDLLHRLETFKDPPGKI